MNPRSPSARDSVAEPAPKKPYRRPELRVYGDLAKVTRAVAGSRNLDGGGHPNRRFTS